MKTVYGNSNSLCVDCDGTSVPNSDQVSCSKCAGISWSDEMITILTDPDADLDIC